MARRRNFNIFGELIRKNWTKPQMTNENFSIFRSFYRYIGNTIRRKH